MVGQNVGQIARFLVEIKAGDHVITPAADTEWLHYGAVAAGPSYIFSGTTDGCPYRHRRRVTWAKERLRRGDFSVPFQNTIRSSLTVFAISQQDEFLAAVGQPPIGSPPAAYDPYRAVLDQVPELDDKEFEILVGHLLTAVGFEGSAVVGKTGDGGVDVTGELNVANLATVKVFVQVKRYKHGTKISANVVRQLRQAIPFGGQGAFITTADFQVAATDVALEAGFPPHRTRQRPAACGPAGRALGGHSGGVPRTAGVAAGPGAGVRSRVGSLVDAACRFRRNGVDSPRCGNDMPAAAQRQLG